MKRSKKPLILLISFALMATTLFAQPGGQRPPQEPSIPNDAQIKQMVNELAQTLELSKEQKAEISDLYDAHFTDVKALMESGQKAQEDQKKVMDTLKKDFDEAIKACLNDEQQKDFEAYLKNHKPGQRQGQGKKGPKRK